ncbi:PDCD2 protein, partial [Smithornis capensis]|nr:PDCD2 protein [Smithornis capensis]
FACRSPACYRGSGPRGPFRGESQRGREGARDGGRRRRPADHRVSPAVFRNQLPRRNDTYPEEPPPEEPPPGPAPAPPPRLRGGAALCRVCGCLGPRCCGRCRRAAYCGTEHQALDWRRGHRRSCGQHAGGDDSTDAIPEHNEFLFPEYEILIEPEEPEFPADSSVDPDDKEAAVHTSKDMKKQEQLGATGNETFQSLDEETLEAMAKCETEEDKIFQMFKEKVAAEPEQIIRYCRGGEGPIWVSGENRPEEKDIPNCLCGAKRIFEFQIMPQLLNHLQVDSLGESIDWGTLVVYTCADNCGGGKEYLEEFIWKQDHSTSHTLLS